MPIRLGTRTPPLLRRSSRWCRILSPRRRIPRLSPCDAPPYFPYLDDVVDPVRRLGVLLLDIEVKMTSKRRRCELLVTEWTGFVFGSTVLATVDRGVRCRSRGTHLFRHDCSLRFAEGVLSHWRINCMGEVEEKMGLEEGTTDILWEEGGEFWVKSTSSQLD